MDQKNNLRTRFSDSYRKVGDYKDEKIHMIVDDVLYAWWRKSSDPLTFVGGSKELHIYKFIYWEYPPAALISVLESFYDSIQVEVFDGDQTGNLYQIDCILKEEKQSVLNKILNQLKKLLS